MKTPEEIKKALEMCARSDAMCTDCPYDPDNDYNAVDYFDDVLSCSDGMESDALEYIKQLEENQTKHGKWELDSSGICIECSSCHHWSVPEVSVKNYKYCPNCGAKMKMKKKMAKKVNATETAYALTRCRGDVSRCAYGECPFKDSENCIRTMCATAAGHMGAQFLRNIFSDDEDEVEEDD